MTEQFYLKWKNMIPNKKEVFVKLDTQLSDIYNTKTKLNYIISFDVEFLNFKNNNIQIASVHELGGIVLNKINNEWYIICIFHVNLKPLCSDLNKLYLLTTTYNSLDTKNEKKIKKLEKKLFIHSKIKNTMSNSEIINIINSSNLSKIYLSKNKIKKLLELKNINFDKFIKKLSKIVYVINGHDLLKYKKEYDIFKKIINGILNDKQVKKRQIEQTEDFLKLTNILFDNSFLIVKTTGDIKAIKTHSQYLNIVPNELNKYFDIAIYNNFLFKKCNSAELKQNYDCLNKLNLTKQFYIYLKLIEDFTDNNIVAHNPLVDAYFTWIIYNVFLLNKLY